MNPSQNFILVVIIIIFFTFFFVDNETVFSENCVLFLIMYFLKNERFREQVRRQHLERYINLSIFLSICSLITIGIMLFFAIKTQFSEQKTVFYILVVLFSSMFISFVITAIYFNNRLKDQEDTQRMRANNLSSMMIRNISSQQSLNNGFGIDPRYEYDPRMQMQNLSNNPNNINPIHKNSIINNSNNRHFARY